MTNKSALKISFVAVASLLATVARAQEQGQRTHDNSGMAGMQTRETRNGNASPEARAANDAMSGDIAGHDMDMNAHMYMTDLRPANPADEKRVSEILAALVQASRNIATTKLRWPRGTKSFCTTCRRSTTTSRTTAMGSRRFAFDPAHPTSLL